MAVEFTEYRGKRKRSFHKRRFPLIRLMFLLLLVILAQIFGFFTKIVNALPLGVNKVDEVEFTWEVMCDSSRGTFSELENGLLQCTWNLKDSIGELPTFFLRYVSSLREFEAKKLVWISEKDDFTMGRMVRLESDSLIRDFICIETNDSSRYWIDTRNGCRFPGLCPQRPLGSAAIPISVNFDFEGQESLLATDVFIGASEVPIYPVLSGVVIDTGKDSLGYFIEIDHGDNVTTKTSGIGYWESNLVVGDTVTANMPVGRLFSKDSASFFLTVRQNGLFIRWDDFYGFSHPVKSSSIAIFRKRIGL